MVFQWLIWLIAFSWSDDGSCKHIQHQKWAFHRQHTTLQQKGSAAWLKVSENKGSCQNAWPTPFYFNALLFTFSMLTGAFLPQNGKIHTLAYQYRSTSLTLMCKPRDCAKVQVHTLVLERSIPSLLYYYWVCYACHIHNKFVADHCIMFSYKYSVSETSKSLILITSIFSFISSRQ